MKYHTFINKDKMPLLGLGTWLSQPDEIYKAIRTAIITGYRHIDCAPVYGNEKEIGKAISDAIKEGDVTRKELWITTKLWSNAHKKESVILAINKSLEDLHLDYVDLYLMHWPLVVEDQIIFPTSGSEFISLDEVPISETWNEMETLINLGLTRHLGVSNFSAKKIEDILSYCKIKPEVNQVEMHPYLQQNKLVEYCKSNDILVTAYAPLGAGKLEPDFLNKGNDKPLLQNDTINKIADELNCTPGQVLLSWGMNRSVSVIPKSTNEGRIKQNFDSVKVELNHDQIAQINTLDKHHRFYDGTGWTIEGSPYTLKNLWDE